MKNLFILGMMLFNLNSFAKTTTERGNGGSGYEAALAAKQEELEDVMVNIRQFFENNRQEAQNLFPEFKVDDLIAKTLAAKIEVVTESLEDRHGKFRTCLNFKDDASITCRLSELPKDPQTLFILMLHETLGLLGVEETSPDNVNVIEGYSIAKRLAPHISKVSNYELSFNSKAKYYLYGGFVCYVSTDRDITIRGERATAVLLSYTDWVAGPSFAGTGWVAGQYYLKLQVNDNYLTAEVIEEGRFKDKIVASNSVKIETAKWKNNERVLNLNFYVKNYQKETDGIRRTLPCDFTYGNAGRGTKLYLDNKVNDQQWVGPMAEKLGYQSVSVEEYRIRYAVEEMLK